MTTPTADSETVFQALPKQFTLLPDRAGKMQVLHAATCVGYVWTEHNRWLARSREGTLLDTGSGETVTEAVSALFTKRGAQPLSAY